MDDDEIEGLIADLRDLLEKHGFAWLVDEATAEGPEESSRRRLAYALVDAAEGVTVDLAQVELAALKGLRVEDIDFKPDESEFRTDLAKEQYRLYGAERRAALERQSELAGVFAELRERLGGDL